MIRVATDGQETSESFIIKTNLWGFVSLNPTNALYKEFCSETSEPEKPFGFLGKKNDYSTLEEILKGMSALNMLYKTNKFYSTPDNPLFLEVFLFNGNRTQGRLSV